MGKNLVRNSIFMYFSNVTRISLFGKLNSWQFIILFLTAIFPLIVYTKYQLWFYLIFISLFISAFLSIREKRSSGEFKKVYGFSLLYVGAVSIQFLVLIVFGLGLAFGNSLTSFNYPIIVLITIIAIIYIFFIVGFLLYFLNYIFLMILKLIFPNQLTKMENEEWLSLREISGYMTLETQISYLLITILHLLIYLSGVFYIMMCLLIYDNTINTNVYFVDLVKWAVDNNVVSFGNTLGIISIVLTLISITYPAQIKLYFKAVETRRESTK
ncbi:hypothetical protein [Psychrobacillus vulpis]|uniref:Uncharacterized protein n=1 Tax=Psychrobacillus vulpis TaxID=2325572 RepID=A0A544TUX5_9BACI|nr:hypothetical protein [Psychrobacillus vulpis]TQR21235.1 hypothetical protein FG384_03235 [Psychrobacillus vulpis]